jgi:hypothetical protein
MWEEQPDPAGKGAVPQLFPDPDGEDANHDRMLLWLVRRMPLMIQSLYSAPLRYVVEELVRTKYYGMHIGASTLRRTCRTDKPRWNPCASIRNEFRLSQRPSVALESHRVFRKMLPRLFDWHYQACIYQNHTPGDQRRLVGFVDFTVDVALFKTTSINGRGLRCPTAGLEKSKIDELPFARRWERSNRTDRFFLDVRYRRPPLAVLVREILTVASFLPDHLPCLFTPDLPVRERHTLNSHGIVVLTPADFRSAKARRR